jgi:NhaA family Na+:H+ antiporter
MSAMNEPINFTTDPDATQANAPLERRFQRLSTPFQEFIKAEMTSGIVLMMAAVVALVLANSALAHAYRDFFHTKLTFALGGMTFGLTLHHWINEGLMGFFFLLAGLEIKREILVGELSRVRQAILPVGAAIGGMAGPAILYAAINLGGPGSAGWGIPMATDIAFAVGVMVLLGRCVPKNLLMFLVALAIVDDLGAVVVIAIFYTGKIALMPLACAGLFIVVAVIMNLAGVRRVIPYLFIGGLLWIAMLHSGLHATLTGVFMAFCIPTRAKYNPARFELYIREIMDSYKSTYSEDRNILTNSRLAAIVQLLEDTVTRAKTPLQRLLHTLHLPVGIAIVPLFALANAGVHIDTDNLGVLFSSQILWGVTAGLVLGKFLGITFTCWLLLRFNIASLPTGVTMSHIAGAALLAGIGFTMSIFIAELAFADAEMLTTAKTGILLASAVAGIAGFIWLRVAGRKGVVGESNY